MNLQGKFLKESNFLNTASNNDRPYLRIHAIDFLKGIAICIIILINTADAWIKDDSRFFYAVIVVIFDVFGTSLFIFLYSITVIFWWKKKMGINPDKAIRNEILSRAIILILLGMLLNLFLLRDIPFPLNLWGWNTLIFIGLAYIICYYSVRLSRGIRWILGFTIFFITTPVRELLIIYKDLNPFCAILYFIIVSPNPEITFLPYISLCFFSTIFGERILESMLLETIEAYLDTFHNLILFGFIFIGLSIYYGYGLVNQDVLDPIDYPSINLITFLNTSGIPGFLVRGTAPNLFYGLGVALLILGISFYYLDIKKKRNSIINVLSIYGNLSLTLFIIHLFGFFLFFKQLDLIMFLPIFFIYLFLLGLLMIIWNYYGRRAGTLEWMISKIRFKK